MKKITFFLAIISIVLACTVETETLDKSNLNLTQELSNLDSSLGFYYGVFSTLNSEYRATVEIQIPEGQSVSSLANIYPRAKITLHTGEVFTAKADQIVEGGQQISNLHFRSADLSFILNVEANGDNPVVSDVVFKKLASDIVLMKQRGLDPPVMLTGTFACIDCGDHPLLGTGATQTFNLVLPDGGFTETTAVTTQIILDGTNYGSTTGNSQNFCVTTGSTLRCNISGNSYGDLIFWQGLHIDNLVDPCNTATGSWIFDSGNYGVLTGYFETDSNCLQNVYLEDFEAFDGSGFTPTPTVGQLDSDIFITGGWSDGSLTFGGTETTGDFARGLDADGGVSTGGVYAFSTGTGTRVFGLQPGGSDFTPGTIDIRVLNDTGTTLSAFRLELDVWVNNDQNRSNRLYFQTSEDGINYTPPYLIPFDYDSEETADTNGLILARHLSSQTGESIPPGQFFYLRITGDDLSGSGARDEIGIDNIEIGAL